MMQRSMNVVLAGTGETRAVVADPQSTVGDLLEQMELTGYEITQGSGTAPLPGSFRLSQLPDNATLFASTIADAGGLSTR